MDIMIKNTVKEFIVHAIYLLIVSTLCFSNQNSNTYLMTKIVNDQLITDPSAGFLQITSIDKYYEWISKTLTPWFLPDLNGKTAHNNLDKILYTQVQDMYRMGVARIRQLRIEKENCTLLSTKIKECVPSFSSGEEETKDYCLGWYFPPCSEFENSNSLSSKAWTHTSAEDIQGLPIAGNYDIYNGGGYITYINFNFQVTQAILKELRQNLWIDHETRAVFIEFTVYCPNINHFAFIIFLLEFNEMGGLIPFVSVYPVSVHNPPGLLGSFVQFCQLIGIVLTILGFIYVIFILGKKKCSAFKDLWFLFDFSAVIIAICTVIIFFLRLSYTKSALNKVKQNRNNYINFYHVVVWDFSYNICLSLLVTIGYLRLLKLASYSEKTMKVYSVLSKAVHVFPGFFFFIFLILLGFIGMGFALFGRTSYYFKDLLTTAESLFTGLLGRSSFRDTNVPLSDRWTTILYFCLFVGIVVIFLTNYFLAVLMDLLVDKGKNYINESTKIFIIMWDSFLQLMGKKRDPTIRLKDILKDNSDSEDETKNHEKDQTMLTLEKNISRLLHNVYETKFMKK